MRQLLWRSAAVGLILTVLAVLSGCTASDRLRQSQTIDGLAITLETPRTPQINSAELFAVDLRDRAGRPIENATVYLDMDMDMLCLSGAAPVAEPVGSGRYEVQSLYQMPGTWRITVTAEVESVAHEALFAVEVPAP
ncbi:MAG: hypothetical protein HC822_13125 [Oscillochloris sp.]|nr:hypothetical protein [Oscillochloris sp.]